MPFNENEFIDSILPNFSINDAKDYRQLNSVIARARKLYDDSWPDSTYATYMEKTDSKYIIYNIIKQAPQINKENFVDFIELNPCGQEIIIEAIILTFEDYWKKLHVYYKERDYYISINAVEVVDQLGRVPIKNLVAFYTMITIALAPLAENTCPRLENIVQAFSLIFTKEAIHRVITIEE